MSCPIIVFIFYETQIQRNQYCYFRFMRLNLSSQLCYIKVCQLSSFTKNIKMFFLNYIGSSDKLEPLWICNYEWTINKHRLDKGVWNKQRKKWKIKIDSDSYIFIFTKSSFYSLFYFCFLLVLFSLFLLLFPFPLRESW